jgi:hypothetical protein
MQHSASSTSNTTTAHPRCSNSNATTMMVCTRPRAKAGASSLTSLAHRPPLPNASSTAPSRCRRTRRAIPSLCTPRRAKPRVPTKSRPRRLRRHDFHAQGRASTPPPARLVISELSTAASRRPPRATRSRLPLPRLALQCIAAHRVLSNSAAVASRLLPIANPAG